MSYSRVTPPLNQYVKLALAVCWLASIASVSDARADIYTCIASDGRKLTSDRTIPECSSREQRVHNFDGSVRAVVPPTMTSEERSEADLAERRRNADRVAQQDAARRDRNLITRYPTEASHQKARESALDDVLSAVRGSEDRLANLTKERTPLLDEAEFYKGKQLPLKLKEQLDANDAASDAQRSLVQNQLSERDRITALFDAELARLRKLWAGAPPGSFGPLPPEAVAGGAPVRR